MGLKRFFSTGKTTSEKRRDTIPWIPLEKEEQLEEILNRSSTIPQVIFKNSTTCGISGMARRAFESNNSSQVDKVGFYLLHIQYNRELSNEIAYRLGIRHESPQILVIKDGRVVHHDSHGQISGISLSEWI